MTRGRMLRDVLVVAVCCLVFAVGDACGSFYNGGFETGPYVFGPTPGGNGWTITTYSNPGVASLGIGSCTSDDPASCSGTVPQSFTDLGLTAGVGTNLTTVETGATETVADGVMGAGASLRYPKYDSYTARINYHSESTWGYGQNANAIRQTMTAAAGDIDPLDGKVHVRFAVAPVLHWAANHRADSQSYFFVQLRNITKSAILFTTFNFANQPGIPWKSVNLSGQTWVYTDWQAFDIAPGNALLAVGDQVELTVVGSGCNAGGHDGHVYVDGIGATLPGLSVSATGPASAAANTDITYTYTYTNAGASAVNGVVVDAGIPIDAGTAVYTTYVSVGGLAPGVVCTPSGGAAAGPPHTPGGRLSCAIGTLAAGASGTFQVTVHIPAGATGPVNNGDYPISGTGVSPLLGPLVQTAIIPAASLSDMAVNAAGLPTTATVGIAYTGTYTCSNNGPQAAATASSASCDAANLPAGISVTGCASTNPAGAWTQPGSVPLNAVVTCTVAGTPTAVGPVTATVSTGDPNDPNTTNNTATPTITVNAPAPPVAVNDAASTPVNATLNELVSILNNDSGSGISLYSVTGTGAACTTFPCVITTTHGSVTVAASGTYVYTPTAGYAGTDSFTYQIRDVASQPANATVTITVTTADLVTSIACVPDPTTVGLSTTCTLTCTNSAGATAAAATVSCNFTGGLPSGAITSGCPETTPSLAIGASLNTCQVTFTPGTAGTIPLAGTATASNEADTANNSSNRSLTVNAAAAGAVDVPTLSEWGMIFFVLAAGLGSALLLRRRGRA